MKVKLRVDRLGETTYELDVPDDDTSEFIEWLESQTALFNRIVTIIEKMVPWFQEIAELKIEQEKKRLNQEDA